MHRKTLLIILAFVALGIGWYLFRPELLFIDATVNEPFMEPAPVPGNSLKAEPVTLASGRFHGVAHEATGVAVIYQLRDGRRLLRLTEFETSNGPDLHVYLVAADDASDNETVMKAGFVSLGALKGNKGNQNYEVSTEIDLAKYRSVSIWCRRFGVNFATAPLTSRHS